MCFGSLVLFYCGLNGGFRLRFWLSSPLTGKLCLRPQSSTDVQSSAGALWGDCCILRAWKDVPPRWVAHKGGRRFHFCPLFCDLEVEKRKKNNHTCGKGKGRICVCCMFGCSPQWPGAPKWQTTQGREHRAMMEGDSGEICQVTGSSWRGISITGCRCIFIPA